MPPKSHRTISEEHKNKAFIFQIENVHLFGNLIWLKMRQKTLLLEKINNSI